MLDKEAVAHGEIWRLLTIVLVHDPTFLLHLLFNMYALYLAGPIVEQLYGARRFVLFYLLAAAGGSISSFAFGSGQYAVGASGAIFGLFGILFVATRAHHPALDRRGRALVGQIGMLLVINLAFGFAVGPQIDNFAHIGGLIAGVAAGYFAEGAGPRDVRKLVQVGGLVALALVGVVMVAARIAAFPSARCFG